jgi:hypothetical protein
METTANHRPAVRAGALLLLALGCSKSDPPPPLDAAPPGVSLLQATPARLALEWQFEDDENTDPFQGWKGKWLAVRIPKDAHVQAIQLHVRTPARASISRDGTKLKEASLSGDSSISIDGPGGDFRVEIFGEPATISKLDVVGQPGAIRKGMGGLPTIRRGSLDVGEHLSGPWPSVEAYCEKRGGDRCNEGIRNFARDRNDGLWFALSSKRGWFVLRGPKEIEHKSIRTEWPDGGAPVTSFVHIDRSTMGMVQVAARELVVCHFVDDYPDCDERTPLGVIVE